jgi:WD40 repeat protein
MLVLCLDQARGPTSAELAKCDLASGTVIESRELPFAASRMALSPSGELVAVAGIVPSPDSRDMNLLRKKGAVIRPHTLRMVLLKGSDLSPLAESDEPWPAEWFEFTLAESLRLVAVPGTKAWALGCTAPGAESYSVSLRDQDTLAETKKELFAMRPDARSTAVVAVSPNDPASVLVGRYIDMRSSYQWDTWDTDSGKHGSYVARVGSGLPKGFYSPLLAMPEQGRLPEIVWACWPVEISRCTVLSVHAQLFARAENGWIGAEFVGPVFEENRYWCRIEIRYFRSWQEITTGEIRGEGNQVTAMRFPPVGERLVTGHRDGSVRIWNLAPSVR